ncbi:MAG: glycosyltransferase [Fibrobacter sp.]|nr:glycosyltransferase [Fibrobacter sp.]
MIKISVIIPIYKVPLDYLRKCLDSLIAQTLPDCEFLLISDGSPKAERNVCKEYTNKDLRFRFFENEHAGVSAARNFGISKANGEYITFVDSDDWIDKECCEQVFNFAKQQNSDILFWNANQYIDRKIYPLVYDTKSINKLSKDEVIKLCKNSIYTSSKKYSNISLVCCKLFKKNLIIKNSIAYPNNIKISEDRFFNIKAFEKANSISFLGKSFYYYRIHKASASHQFVPNAITEYTKFLQDFTEEQKKNYSDSIIQEYVRVFFASWKICYLHPSNTRPFTTRIQDIIQLTKQSPLKEYLQKPLFMNFPLILKIEIFLLKKNIPILVYIHGIKAKLFKQP